MQMNLSGENTEKEKKHNFKFQNCSGTFWLNWIRIDWTLDISYNHVYHFEFNGKPNVLTETGYRSAFLNIGDVEFYETLQKCIEEFLKYQIKKPYKVRWGGNPQEISYEPINPKKKKKQEEDDTD